MADESRLRRSRVVKSLRRGFLAGVLVILPLVATIVVLVWLFNSIDGLLSPVVELIFGRPVPGVGFAAILILIYLAGIFATNVLGRTAIRYGESLLARVPMVREIYNTTRQILDSVMLSRKTSFREVVLVEFPRAGMRTIGFVTNRMQDSSGQELLSVFIPTAPNPTSGFLEIVSADRVVPTSMPVDEAMKMIISAGMVSPAIIDSGTGEQGAI